MQAVLMVAGKSTRTYPLTLTRPKPLLPIMNRSLIMHSLDQMEGLFDQVILIVGYRQEMIKSMLGNRYKNIDLIYQEQEKQLGTGDAILQAKSFIKGKFVAMNGDDLFAREDLKRLIELNDGALAKKVEDPSLYGVYEVDKKSRALHLVEKPKEPVGNLANIGCYVFQPDIFDKIEKTSFSERGEIEIVDAILQVMKERDFNILPINGFWLPTGYAWDLLMHQEFFMPELTGIENQGTVEDHVVFHGPVRIGKGTIIKSGTYIEGPVIVGDNCNIGPNCYLRKHSSIGDECRIGQGVEIKNSLIMNGSTVAHLSYIGDSVIGEGCNIGGGSITANKRHDDNTIKSMIKGKLVDSRRQKLGAILADHVSLGIHTSIYPGRKIWPRLGTHPGTIVDRDIME